MLKHFSHGNGIYNMALPNLEKMSLKELLELEAQVQSAITSARSRSRAEVKKAMAELAEKHGFKLQELMGGRGKGKITAPKFANPEDPSQTWTGRGRKEGGEDGGLCDLAVPAGICPHRCHATGRASGRRSLRC